MADRARRGDEHKGQLVRHRIVIHETLSRRLQFAITGRQRHTAQATTLPKAVEVIVEPEELSSECTDQIRHGSAKDEPSIAGPDARAARAGIDR